jgi:hypothetical protein
VPEIKRHGGLADLADLGLTLADGRQLLAEISVLRGCAGSRKGQSTSMLVISTSCRTKLMLPIATTFRGQMFAESDRRCRTGLEGNQPLLSSNSGSTGIRPPLQTT